MSSKIRNMNVKEYKNLERSGQFVSGTERDIYREVKIDKIGTIKRGDYVVWEDPDSFGNRYVGKIDSVFDINGKELPEFSTTIPVGRIDLKTILFISGEDGRYVAEGHEDARKLIDQFMNSDYKKYMKRTYTGGTVEEDGE